MEGQTGDLTRFGRRQSCGGQCGEEAGDTYEAWGLGGGGQGERKRDSMALRGRHLRLRRRGMMPCCEEAEAHDEESKTDE